jgi:hypothetical protein
VKVDCQGPRALYSRSLRIKFQEQDSNVRNAHLRSGIDVGRPLEEDILTSKLSFVPEMANVSWLLVVL